ncbi:MAG: hypothetical protein ACOC6Q_01825 [Patescibacteria group bacterium]
MNIIYAAGETIENPLVGVEGVGALANYIGTFWTLAYIIGGILLLIYLIIGAIQYLTAGADKEATAGAMTMLTNAFMGLVILAISFPVIKVVEIVFGIDILQITWPTV